MPTKSPLVCFTSSWGPQPRRAATKQRRNLSPCDLPVLEQPLHPAATWAHRRGQRFYEAQFNQGARRHLACHVGPDPDGVTRWHCAFSAGSSHRPCQLASSSSFRHRPPIGCDDRKRKGHFLEDRQSNGLIQRRVNEQVRCLMEESDLLEQCAPTKTWPSGLRTPPCRVDSSYGFSMPATTWSIGRGR